MWKPRKDAPFWMLLRSMERALTVSNFCLFLDYVLAFCGGNCHCGGCHIKLAQAVSDLLPRPSEKEAEVLKKCVDVDER